MLHRKMKETAGQKNWMISIAVITKKKEIGSFHIIDIFN